MKRYTIVIALVFAALVIVSSSQAETVGECADRKCAKEVSVCGNTSGCPEMLGCLVECSFDLDKAVKNLTALKDQRDLSYMREKG